MAGRAVTTQSAPDLKRLGDLTRLFLQQVAENKIRKYKPYEWQRDFHSHGLHCPERMLMAANRVGKTISAACEVSFHLTGDYPKPGEYRYSATDTAVIAGFANVGDDVWPEGWTGKRFERPTLVWTGSPTNETSRDIVQAELLGGLGEKLGTGWVPKAKILGTPKTRQAGVKDVVDSFQVRHKSGGLSTCNLKTYEQGWQKWQGTAPHVVWLDEEPDDYKIFSEAQTRILTSKGILLVTFTPLLGETELVLHFRDLAGVEGSGVYLRGASWNDAPHLSDEDKTRLAASYRAHERKARTEGIPMMGEGAVFPVNDDQISIQPFEIPKHWARIKGIDFGIAEGHPAAGAEIAWDRDQDVIYVIDCYRKSHEEAPYHVAWLNKSNKDVPVAWPHDGMNREKVGGRILADAYRSHGANMLAKSARYKVAGESDDKGGPQPVEPIVEEVLERMMTGRFRVFAHLSEWFEEKRSYHRKDGLIVARRDDILKATFYAIMMRRYAISLNALVAQFARSNAPSAPIASMRL